MPRYLVDVLGTIRSDELLSPTAVPTPILALPVLTVELPVALADDQVTDIVVRVRVRTALPG